MASSTQRAPYFSLYLLGGMAELQAKASGGAATVPIAPDVPRDGDVAAERKAAERAAAEAERLASRMLQLFVWSEQREQKLRAAAQQQLTTIRGSAEGWHQQAERRKQVCASATPRCCSSCSRVTGVGRLLSPLAGGRVVAQGGE